MPAVVSDSTPLIYLARLERLSWLRVFYGQVMIPNAVWREVAINGGHLPEGVSVRKAADEGWMTVETPGLLAAEFGLDEGELGAGELEAILLAKERAAVLVIDERLGRLKARHMDIDITGTGGLVLRAKRQGLIKSVSLELRLLLSETTFYMSDDLFAAALAEAGESEP